MSRADIVVRFEAKRLRWQRVLWSDALAARASLGAFFGFGGSRVCGCSLSRGAYSRSGTSPRLDGLAKSLRHAQHKSSIYRPLCHNGRTFGVSVNLFCVSVVSSVSGPSSPIGERCTGSA